MSKPGLKNLTTLRYHGSNVYNGRSLYWALLVWVLSKSLKPVIHMSLIGGTILRIERIFTKNENLPLVFRWPSSCSYLIIFYRSPFLTRESDWPICIQTFPSDSDCNKPTGKLTAWIKSPVVCHTHTAITANPQKHLPSFLFVTSRMVKYSHSHFCSARS